MRLVLSDINYSQNLSYIITTSIILRYSTIYYNKIIPFIKFILPDGNFNNLITSNLDSVLNIIPFLYIYQDKDNEDILVHNIYSILYQISVIYMNQGAINIIFSLLAALYVNYMFKPSSGWLKNVDKGKEKLTKSIILSILVGYSILKIKKIIFLK